jgi:hypothetical protein
VGGVAAAASNARLTQALARECIACMHAGAARLWWHVDVCELPRAFSFVPCSLYTKCVSTSVPTQSWGQYRHQVLTMNVPRFAHANVQWMTPVSLHRSMPTFETSPRTFLTFLQRRRPPSLTDACS